MGFDAGTAVEALDWDFTKYNAGSGTSPEPSSKEIDRFFRKQQMLISALQRVKGAMVKKELERNQGLSGKEALAELNRWAEMSVEDAIEILADEVEALIPLDELEKYTRRMAELVGELTHNCPSAEQIMKVPHRIRAIYFQWLGEQLSNPESLAGGSKISPAALNGNSLFT